MPDHKALRCDCGREVTGRDEADLVSEIQRHAQDAHGITFSAEDALLVLFRSQLELSPGVLTTDTRDARAVDEGGGR